MFQSIPASKIVSVNPAVLGTGGSPLSMNGVFLTNNPNIPIDQAVPFSTDQAVADFFGETSEEYKAAQIYFLGFNNSTIKPSTMYFFQYNAQAVEAYTRGASVQSMTLTDLQALTGNIAVKIDGTNKTATAVNLSTATSFSDAAVIIGTALDADVQFDTQLQAFEIHSAVTGEASTIEYATGPLATALSLTQTKGAVISPGANADSPTHAMNQVEKSTLNWATFTTIYEPTLTDKVEFGKWSNMQNCRYLYVGWDTDASTEIAGNTTCFSALMKEAQYDGVMPLYSGLDKAAFVCGMIASIDFTERNGRVNFAFRAQAGLSVDVTDATVADNVLANGSNFYGAYATANDRFIFLYNGSVSGRWKWANTYIHQIRLNSQLQLALISLLISAKSVPYNAVGIALQRAACLDPINEALNFGTIREGVKLSEQQRAIINNEAGLDAASQIETTGYYLLIQQATAQVRGLRASMPMKLWYADGGDVNMINLASIAVQ
jgi:hypothetical protein